MSRKIIVKQNDLIENFVFNATESELQILNYAVAITNPHWENKGLVYRIDIPELVKIYQSKSNNIYKLYRDALTRLMDRKYYFYDKNIKQTENLVVRVSEDIDDSSYLVFKFNEYISTRISELKGLFTKYDIKHIANFKSRYAFMLYEFFKMKLQQQENKAKFFIKDFTIEEFKQRLDISDKYERFSNLEKIVLVAAKENINNHSDIEICYTVKRKGRTPTHIKFTAKFKKNHNAKAIVIETKSQNGRADSAKKGFTEEHKTTAKKHLGKLKERLKT